VAIVALDAEDRVALVRQWRLPADAALLEIPAGGLDLATDGSKEDPDIASRRELEEETGLRARTWRKLGVFYTAPGFTDELMHLYLATDLEPATDDGRLGPDEDERLILEWRPWQEAVAAADSGEIRDAKSIVGLFWLERLRRGQDATGTAAPVAGGVAAGLDAGGAPTVGESVTVTYRMTMGEMLRASVGLARRSILVRVFGLLMVAVAIVPVMNGDVISLVFLVLGLAIATGWFTAPFAWWMFRKRPDLVGADTTLTLDGDGVGSGTDFGRGRTAWSTFRKVHEVGDCFLFDTAAGVSMIVPKRAFTDAHLAVVYRLLDRNGLLASGARG
jgi:ADP-ribose pyrophosphatase